MFYELWPFQMLLAALALATLAAGLVWGIAMVGLSLLRIRTGWRAPLEMIVLWCTSLGVVLFYVGGWLLIGEAGIIPLSVFWFADLALLAITILHMAVIAWACWQWNKKRLMADRG